MDTKPYWMLVLKVNELLIELNIRWNELWSAIRIIDPMIQNREEFFSFDEESFVEMLTEAAGIIQTEAATY